MEQRQEGTLRQNRSRLVRFQHRRRFAKHVTVDRHFAQVRCWSNDCIQKKHGRIWKDFKENPEKL